MCSTARDIQILVVDDQRQLADLYTYWLQDSYSVRTAYSGRDALELLDETTDMVLLDRDMPDLTGDEVLERIRDRGLACPVTMVTGERPDIDVIDMHFDDYLVKPVQSDELRNAVERMVERTAYEQEVQEYFALVSKQATLREHVASETLADSESYDVLERRLTELKERLDESVAGFGANDFAHVFRRLNTPTPTSEQG